MKLLTTPRTSIYAIPASVVSFVYLVGLGICFIDWVLRFVKLELLPFELNSGD